MKRHILLAMLVIISQLTTLPAQETYDARIGKKEILTPAPAKHVQINGPKIYGARPGKKFIYRIPCQGERPILFKVKDLPKGLKLDKETGIITGVVPEKKGDYSMNFRAQNQFGEVERAFKLIVGDKLALTPPTGWNSWGGHMIAVSDEIMRKAADLFEEEGLADVGFQYISIDDCWMRPVGDKLSAQQEAGKNKFDVPNWDIILEGGRDEQGNILPNERFPDMKAMTDHIHSYGLKAGIYSSPSELTCQKYIGSRHHEKQDVEQYAKWGFDLLKYDQCGAGTFYLKTQREANPDYKYSEYWKPMADYLLEQDRDILYNLCQYGWEDPWTWAPALGISTWRSGGDLNHHVDQYFKQALRHITELRDYNKPGQWNDPDFMYIHKIRDAKNKAAPSREIALNTNQRYQYVTLWSIICAPYFFSCDINEIDAFTISLMANADVVNINQDELAHVAEVVRNKDNEVVLHKNLADGSHAMAVFNTNENEEAVIHVDWSEFGECCEQSVYDVWRQKDLGMQKIGMSVRLSPNGVAYFVVSGLSARAQDNVKKPVKLDRFEKQIENFRRFDNRNSLPENPVLFVGSSSIVHWETARSFPEYPVINRGFGGASIPEVIYYYDDVIKKHSPSILVLYSDIDIEKGRSPDEAFDAYKMLIGKVKKDFPLTKIIILSMKPAMVDDRLGEDVRSNKILTNDKLNKYCDSEKNLQFVDITFVMLEPDGSLRKDIFLPDGMHLNPLGYSLWDPLIRQELKKLTIK